MSLWVRAGNIGERLREVRVGLGMSQAQFGELIGVLDQTVSDYEGGRYNPSRGRLERLARRLRVPVDIFAEGGPMPSTLPMRPVEPRSGEGPDLEAMLAKLRELEARNTFLTKTLEAYVASGVAPSPALLAEVLEVSAAIGRVRDGLTSG